MGDLATPLRVFHGDGDGPTTEVTATHLPALSGVQRGFGALDLDGDGADDAGDFFEEEMVGRGAIAADLDLDGDVDLVVQRSNEPTLVVENRGTPKNSWVEVALSDGTGRNRFGVGARVEISVAGRRQVRQVTCGDSYCSQRPLTLHFGLGAGEPAAVEVKVRWPDGTAQRFPDVKPRQRVVLRREEGKAQ